MSVVEILSWFTFAATWLMVAIQFWVGFHLVPRLVKAEVSRRLAWTPEQRALFQQHLLDRPFLTTREYAAGGRAQQPPEEASRDD